MRLKKTNRIQYSCVLDREMYNWFKEQAEENLTTMRAEIYKVLRNYYNEQKNTSEPIN